MTETSEQDGSDNIFDDLLLGIDIDLFNANKLAGLIKAKLENKQNRQRIGSLFKRRFKSISSAVVSNRVWLKSSRSSMCDVLVIFPQEVSYQTLGIVLERFLKEDLIVSVKLHKTTQTIAFYITASYERFLKASEEFLLRKPIKANYGGGIKEFIYEEQEFYENIENEELFLTTQEKQSIIFEILDKIRSDDRTPDGHIELDQKKLPNGTKLIHWCLGENVIKNIFPVHEQETLQDLRHNWVFTIHKSQPLDKICNYFGIKLALYFAWLGFYTKSLAVPALIGLIIWLNLDKDDVNSSILLLILCGSNLVWSICFNDFWKRKCSEYSYKWGTLGTEEHLLIEEPRPMFKGVYQESEVTKKIEPHYPEWKRNLFHYFITLPCIFLIILFTFLLMVVMFKLQQLVDYGIDKRYLPGLFGLTSFIPKLIYADLITTLNSFYQKLCTWLNDKENYRELSTHENHLMVKVVIFQFINSYLSLFYIAFYLRDIPLLRAQLFAIFMTRQLTGNIKESLIPYIIASLQQIKLIGKTQKETSWSEANQDLVRKVSALQRYAQNFMKMRDIASRGAEGDDDDDEANENKADLANDKEIGQPEVESLMPTYPDTLSDYLEMVNQFGLIVFFAPAFPLAALFSMANNIIEIRSDAFKMCLLFQRPFGQRVANIGTWQNILETFSMLGILVNCGLLVTFDIIPKLIPSLDYYQSFFFIIIIEHAFLAISKYLKYIIPDMPEWIIIEKSKLEFRRREALRKIESNEIHNLKNLNKNGEPAGKNEEPSKATATAT